MPTLAYMCTARGEGIAPVPVRSGVPSPNDRFQDVMVPLESELPVESKVTASGAIPEPGLIPSAASGSVGAPPPFARTAPTGAEVLPAEASPIYDHVR